MQTQSSPIPEISSSNQLYFDLYSTCNNLYQIANSLNSCSNQQEIKQFTNQLLKDVNFGLRRLDTYKCKRYFDAGCTLNSKKLKFDDLGRQQLFEYLPNASAQENTFINHFKYNSVFEAIKNSPNEEWIAQYKPINKQLQSNTCVHINSSNTSIATKQRNHSLSECSDFSILQDEECFNDEFNDFEQLSPASLNNEIQIDIKNLQIH